AQADLEISFFHTFKYAEATSRNGVELPSQLQYPRQSSLPTAILQYGFKQRMHRSGAQGVRHGNALRKLRVQEVIPVLGNGKLAFCCPGCLPSPAHGGPCKICVRTITEVNNATCMLQHNESFRCGRPKEVELPFVTGQHFVQRRVRILVEHPHFDVRMMNLKRFYHGSHDVFLV